MSTVISVENISKQYRLGEVGTGTLSHDFNRWWHRVRGKEDPYLKVGEINDRSKKGDSDYSWALKDVSFEVKQGEVLGIIGRNGAGKSTLLKILSRVTQPTTGEIKVKGRIASLLEVGTGFHPELSGRENIFLNGAILGMRKAEIAAKFDEIVDFSGCERYIDTPVKRYSSGMYVRLAFAVAAHLEPEILIVDEVLAVGDAEFQKKCMGKMKDVAGQGRTVLFVSHNMASIQALSDDCCILQNGKLLFYGITSKAISIYNENARISLHTDVHDLKRRNPEWGHDVRIQNIEVNERGQASYQIDEIVTLSIQVKAIQDFETLAAGVTVSTFGETPIATGFTNHFSLKKSENNRINIRIPACFLAPGEYALAISIYSGDKSGGRRNLDIVHNVGPLIIATTANTPENIVRWESSHYGNIMIHSIEAQAYQY